MLYKDNQKKCNSARGAAGDPGRKAREHEGLSPPRRFFSPGPGGIYTFGPVVAACRLPSLPWVVFFFLSFCCASGSCVAHLSGDVCWLL